MAGDIREAVRRRANGRCEYCRLPEEFDEWPFHVEHVIPRQHGGADHKQNLAWACRRCNLHKGPNLATLDPATHEVTPLFDPRRQQWVDHFSLVGARIVGQTAGGRGSVELLDMNHSQRLLVRGMLIADGLF